MKKGKLDFFLLDSRFLSVSKQYLGAVLKGLILSLLLPRAEAEHSKVLGEVSCGGGVIIK